MGQAVLSDPDHVPLEGKINLDYGDRRKIHEQFALLIIFYDFLLSYLFASFIQQQRMSRIIGFSRPTMIIIQSLTTAKTLKITNQVNWLGCYREHRK